VVRLFELTPEPLPGDGAKVTVGIDDAGYPKLDSQKEGHASGQERERPRVGSVEREGVVSQDDAEGGDEKDCQGDKEGQCEKSPDQPAALEKLTETGEEGRKEDGQPGGRAGRWMVDAGW
jgi:hypothetical protein